MVRQVLDVSDGAVLGEGDAIDGMELAIVKEKLTTIHRDFGAKAAAAWKEVA